MADKRELLLVAKFRDDGTKRGLKGIGDEAEDTHDNLDNMRVGLDKLDKKIGDTKTGIEGLRREIGKTGDLELFKDLEKQTARLKNLTRKRGLLDFGEVGREGGRSFLSQFTSNIKELPLQVKGHLLAGAVIGGAAAAPVLAGAISGAVTAGLATGVVAGGIALAAQDPAVKKAAGDLGDTLKAELTAAASAFVPETIKAIGIIKREFLALRPELRALFDDAARFVQPLTLAATGFVREMVPGIREAVSNARPLVDMLSTALPQFGKALGDVFATMSQHAETSAEALRTVLALGELTLGGTAGSLALLNQIAPFVSGNLFALGKVMEDDEVKARLLAAAEKAAADAAQQQALAGGALSSALIAGSVQALRMAEAVRGLIDANRTAFDSETQFEQAVDDLSASLKENGKTLNANTEKGRANRDALSNLARATLDATDAAQKSGASQEKVSGIMQRGYTKFIAAATAMTGSAAKARELARSLGLIPPAKNVAVTANTKPAMTALQKLRAYIANFPKFVRVTIQGDVIVKGGGRITAKAKGGPVGGPGPKNVDSQLLLAAPGEHLLTAREVDAAGGHKAIEAWRKSLLHGRAPAVVKGTARAAAPPAMSLTYVGGGSALDDLFASWLHKAIREGKIRMRAGSTAVSVA